MPTADYAPPSGVNVSGLSSLAGFEVTAYGRFWVTTEALLLHSVGDACIADSGYDADWFRDLLKAIGLKAVIASKVERPRAIPKDRKLYALRYLVEKFFHGLKRFRRLATRYEKSARNYLALIHVACIRTWIN